MIDRVISCTDRAGLNLTRRLAREEAIFVGGSGGMAAWVALEVARELTPNDLVVVLLPDTGERYLSKVHNDAWMRDNHLLDPSMTRVADVASGKTAGIPRIVSIQAHESLRSALAILEKYDITQIPVFRGGEVVGTLNDSEILRLALGSRAALEKPVEELMGAPLPVIGADEPVDQVARLLASRNPAVLIRENGAVIGILTRFDMLQFIAGGE